MAGRTLLGALVMLAGVLLLVIGWRNRADEFIDALRKEIS